MSVRIRVRPCGKHRHPSQGAAEAHVRALEKRDGNPVPQVPYWCWRCRAWHVGTPRTTAKAKGASA